MAHIRKPLAAAVPLNTGVFVVEAAAGAHAHSLSLLMDAVHNFSDELALICLLAAYLSTLSLSRGLQRTGNLLNSLGLITVSTVIVSQAVDRVLDPVPVTGWLPATVGMLAAVGNWGVARVLRDWRQRNAAIRLAYLHNLGDMYVSLAPVAAGFLVTLTGLSVFDAMAALAVGAWLIGSTVLELRRSGEELLWPANATCPHEEPGQEIVAAH